MIDHVLLVKYNWHPSSWQSKIEFLWGRHHLEKEKLINGGFFKSDFVRKKYISKLFSITYRSE